MRLSTSLLALFGVIAVSTASSTAPPAPSRLNINAGPDTFTINKNYTIDVGYEKVDIAIHYADFFPQFTRISLNIDAKGTVYDSATEEAYLSPDAHDWELAGHWEFGNAVPGVLKVDAIGRIPSNECLLEFKMNLTGTGPVLKKLNSVIGPETYGDDQLKSDLKALGLCT